MLRIAATYIHFPAPAKRLNIHTVLFNRRLTISADMSDTVNDSFKVNMSMDILIFLPLKMCYVSKAFLWISQ